MSTDPVAALRSASLRVTKQRIAVWAALRHHPHADVEQLCRVVREDLGSISTQAVYDVLAALLEAGLVRRLEVGTRARFELRDSDHDHVACRGCGAVADVERGDGPAPLGSAQTHGYRVDEAEVTYWGRCPSCQPKPYSPIPD